MDTPSLPHKIQNPHKITIYKNGNHKNLFYYFTWKKKVFRSSTGYTDLQQSINKSIEIFWEVSKGVGKPKKTKFQTLVKKFLEYKDSQGLSEKSMVEYRRQSKYLIEKFRDNDVELLGLKKVYFEYQNWRRLYYEKHPNKVYQRYKRNNKRVKGRVYKEIGNHTINRELRLLVSILRFGKDYMGLYKNNEIQPYTMLPEKRREKILSKDDYLKLKEYWIKHKPYYWDIISFVNNTGVRYPSELNNIKWKDVDLKRDVVLIKDRKNKNKSNPVNTPIPLIGNGKDIIVRLYERNKEKGFPVDGDFPVFVNNNGLQIKDIRKSFKKSLKDCDIDQELTMYSLRHLYTTRMVKRSDIPLKLVSYTLGHSDTTMVEKVYSHLKSDDVVKIFKLSEDNKQIILNKEKEDVEKEIKDKKKILQNIQKQLDNLNKIISGE